MTNQRPHATNLAVWQAALAMVIAIGGVGVGIVYFIAGIESSVAANVTAIEQVDDRGVTHGLISSTRFRSIEATIRNNEINTAVIIERIDASKQQLNRIESLVREASQ